MRASVEVSMYPLGPEYRTHIQAFIDRLHSHAGLTVQTNALSTQIFGELEQIMPALTQEMSRAASEGPQPVFVMKVLPGHRP